MSNGSSKGRLLQIKQGYSNGDPIPNFENGEFGLVLDEGQEELYIGSNSGNIQVVTERNIAQLAIPDSSVSRAKLDGEVNTLLDNLISGGAIPLVTASKDGLMSKEDKIKLSAIESGANKTTVVNNLTSLSTTSALSAYQGKLLKDSINAITSGSGVVDNLTSTDTSSALSANQGRIIKGLIDNKADKTTATTTVNGLMSSDDKQKLDSIVNGATNTVVANNLTSTSSTQALSANQGKVLNDKINAHMTDVASHVTSSEKATWNAKASTSVATNSSNGLMSSADKTKLNGIETNANNYVLPIASTTVLGGVKAGTNITIASDGTISSTVSGGNNYTHPTGDGNLHVPATSTSNNGKVLKAGATAGSISWGTLNKSDVGLGNVDNTSDVNKPISTAVQTALNGKASTDVATTSTNGLMSSADKVKLNSIATGANSVTVIDNLTSTSSTSALSANQGKVLNDSKLSISGGNMQGQLVAQSNTAYSSRQTRNIIYSTIEPTSSDGQNGDMWVVYV